MTEEPLFPPAFLAAVDALKPRSGPADSLAPAEYHRGPRCGDSLEFQDYRDYTPGDDPRHLDWNVFRRHRKLLLRRYRHFPRLDCRVVLDHSASIRFTPERARTAFRAAAAIAGTLLANGDAVLLLAAPGPARRFTGRRDLPRLFECLLHLHHGPAGSAPELPPPDRRRSWVVSDFLDPAGLDHLARALTRTGPFTPVQIFDSAEELPNFSSEIRLLDSETGAAVNFSPDRASQERYRERYLHFLELLRQRGRTGGSLIRIGEKSSIAELLNALYPERVLELDR